MNIKWSRLSSLGMAVSKVFKGSIAFVQKEKADTMSIGKLAIKNVLKSSDNNESKLLKFKFSKNIQLFI